MELQPEELVIELVHLYGEKETGGAVVLASATVNGVLIAAANPTGHTPAGTMPE